MEKKLIVTIDLLKKINELSGRMRVLANSYGYSENVNLFGMKTNLVTKIRKSILEDIASLSEF